MESRYNYYSFSNGKIKTEHLDLFGVCIDIFGLSIFTHLRLNTLYRLDVRHYGKSKSFLLKIWKWTALKCLPFFSWLKHFARFEMIFQTYFVPSHTSQMLNFNIFIAHQKCHSAPIQNILLWCQKEILKLNNSSELIRYVCSMIWQQRRYEFGKINHSLYSEIMQGETQQNCSTNLDYDLQSSWSPISVCK